MYINNCPHTKMQTIQINSDNIEMRSLLIDNFSEIFPKSSSDIKKLCETMKALMKNGENLNPISKICENYSDFQPLLSSFIEKIIKFHNSNESEYYFCPSWKKKLEFHVTLRKFRPIIELLLYNGAKTFDEHWKNLYEHVIFREMNQPGMEFITQFVVNGFRHEQVVIKNLQLGNLDVSSNFSHLPLDIIQQIGVDLIRLKPQSKSMLFVEECLISRVLQLGAKDFGSSLGGLPHDIVLYIQQNIIDRKLIEERYLPKYV